MLETLSEIHSCISLIEQAASAVLKGENVVIRIHLGDGPDQGCAWGCDLSNQYVRINADYTN